MHTTKIWGGIACLLGLLTGLVGIVPANAQSGVLYFPETGHVVSGEFLEFYNRTPEAKLLYGDPITDAFVDPQYGMLVQYFQKVRFQVNEDKPLELRVTLSHLGKFTYQPGQQRIVSVNSNACRTFSETTDQFNICYAFLDFFLAHGGVTQFGYPLSNLESHEGRIMQYFQKARFEWHPELPQGQRVQLSDLGSIYFFQQRLDQNFLRQQNNLPQTILSLKVRAFAERAISGLKGSQTIHVLVHDQNFLPVAKAMVSLQMQSPTGESVTYPIEISTDKDGLAHLTMTFETDQPGKYIITVKVRLNGLTGQTSGSFIAWH
jgi:hypothetical protein